jgi:predicted nuclease of predicted toxin-antitoxin system
VSCRCGTRHEISDNNLSPVLADELKTAGHDAVHVRDYGLQAATDQVVLAQARGESRVLISADTDFRTLLAREGADRPSIMLIRRLTGRRAIEQAAIILANLDVVSGCHHRPTQTNALTCVFGAVSRSAIFQSLIRDEEAAGSCEVCPGKALREGATLFTAAPPGCDVRYILETPCAAECRQNLRSRCGQKILRPPRRPGEVASDLLCNGRDGRI